MMILANESQFDCFFINIVILYFIKYELDGMNVYVWYDVISMFVNDVMCDRDIVSSGKEIPVLRLLGCALFGDSKEVS